jgi:hypothetical protein
MITETIHHARLEIQKILDRQDSLRDFPYPAPGHSFARALACGAATGRRSRAPGHGFDLPHDCAIDWHEGLQYGE